MGKYEDLRDKIRKDVEKTARWKYLRENDAAKSFNRKRHTSLREYLNEIFPDTTDWVYNVAISDCLHDELALRGDVRVDRRVRPDAFSRSLRIIVEFDGIDHYAKPLRIHKDRERDEEFKSLSIDVVRIPYWIQLSKDNVNYLFSKLEFSGAKVCMEHEMCELKYSFFDDGHTDFGLSISPAAMCPLGFERFCNEVVGYPSQTQEILEEDLSLVSDACMEKYHIEAAIKDLNPLFAKRSKKPTGWD